MLVPVGSSSDPDVSTVVSSPEVDAAVEVNNDVTAALSKSTFSRSSKKTDVSAASSKNIFTISNIAILSAIGLSLILMTDGLACFCARDTGKSPVINDRETTESHGTFYRSTDDSFATQMTNNTYSGTNGTTFMSSNYGLAIPGYLLLKYGVSIRSKKEIARGGFGRIMLGEVLDMQSLPSSTPVIIKEMLKEDGQVSQREIESFYQEVSLMTYLIKHKNIATLYGYTEQPYTIVMKYYPIGSLATWIYSHKTRKTVSLIFYFALDIAQGVECIWLKVLSFGP